MFFLRLEATQGTSEFTIRSEISQHRNFSFLRCIKITFSQSQIKSVLALAAENAAFMRHELPRPLTTLFQPLSPPPRCLALSSVFARAPSYTAEPLTWPSLSSGAPTSAVQTEDRNERQGANYFNSLRSLGLTMLSRKTPLTIYDINIFISQCM